MRLWIDKTGLMEKVREVIGVQEKQKAKRWFREACKKAVEERRKMKSSYQAKIIRATLYNYTAAKK